MPGPRQPVKYNAAPSQPLGWFSVRTNQRGSATIFPSQRSGAQVMMRRQLTDRFLPSRESQIPLTEAKTYADKIDGLQIVLSEQRILSRNFLGLRLCVRKSDQKEVSKRLHSPPKRGKSPTLSLPSIWDTPKLTQAEIDALVQRLSNYDRARVPESKGYRIPSATNSQVKVGMDNQLQLSEAELKEVISRLASYDKAKGPADSQGTRKHLHNFRPKESALKTPTPSVEKIINRLSTFDKTKWPPESGALGNLVPQERKTTSAGRTASPVPPNVLYQIIERLSQYNPKKWPPGSEKKKVQEKKKKPVSKEISERAQQIVDRLMKFDQTRWPPESRGTKRKIFPFKQE